MTHDTFLRGLQTLTSIPASKSRMASILSEGLSDGERQTFFQKLCLVEARLRVANQEMTDALQKLDELLVSATKLRRTLRETVGNVSDMSHASQALDDALSQ